MKWIFLILISVFSVQILFAQDVMEFTDRSILQTKVLEVLETSIKYKRFDNLDGPTYSVSKGKIYRIVYQNGVVENYTKMPGNKLAEPKATALKKEVVEPKQEVEFPKKPTFAKYTPSQYEAERKKMYSEKKEAPLLDTSWYKYALMKVPNIPVYTTNKEKVKLYDYLKSKPEFLNKPTLIITWSWSWCPPCVRIIDTLLSQYQTIKDEFNILLLNRGEFNQNNIGTLLKEGSIDKAREFLVANNRSDFYSKCTMLFDYNNEMEIYDEGSTPLFFWVNKELAINSTFLGYAISIEEIKKIFENTAEIHNDDTLCYTDFTADMFPSVDKTNAEIRIIRERISNNIIKLEYYILSSNTTKSIEYFKVDSDNNVFQFR